MTHKDRLKRKKIEERGNKWMDEKKLFLMCVRVNCSLFI